MQSAAQNHAALAEPAVWASTTGNRLKYLQANLSDEPAPSRQEFLAEELQRALQPVPASKRGAYLDALAERFPTWEFATVSAHAPAPIAQQTPDEVVKAFIQLVPQLSGAQRDKVMQQLAGLGVVQTTSALLDGEALAEVQAKFKLGPKDQIDPQRLGKLFATFADLMLTLDVLAWNVWRNAAPKSTVRRDASQGELRTLARRSLLGDAEASAAQVQKQLEKTRQLLAGILAGIGPSGKQFAKRYQQRYSPDAIREAVRNENSGGLFANAEARCWKKYSDLAHEITEATIESDVQAAVVQYTEEVIQGSSR